MLIRDKKHFVMGSTLAIGFIIVFAFLFTPNFGDGLNAFEASDKMFNSISKGSTDYIAPLRDQAKAFEGSVIDVTVLEDSSSLAAKAATILAANNLQAEVGPSGLVVKESLGAILGAALADSRSMFDNDGAALSGRYGMDEKQAMFVWWKFFKSMDTALKAQKRFKEAKFASTVVAKGVEVGYNYYQVVPESASSKMGMLVFALVFYVIYTMWWGYAIFFLFEGIGLVMKAGAKKEV